MDELLKKANAAEEEIDKVFGNTAYLDKLFSRYQGYIVRDKSAHLKWMYIGAMSSLLLTGLYSNITSFLNLNRRILPLVILGIFASCASGCYFGYKGDRRKNAVAIEDTQDEYMKELTPIKTKFDSNKSIQFLPRQYQHPAAAQFIRETIQKKEADTLEQAINNLETHLEEIKKKAVKREFYEYQASYNRLRSIDETLPEISLSRAKISM